MDPTPRPAAESPGAPGVPGAGPAPAGPDSGGTGGDEAGWVTSRPPRGIEVLRRVVGFPALALHHRDLISTSVKRELRARFTGTALGWLWPLVHPLFIFIVYYFIFTKFLGMKFEGLPEEQKPAFGVFMFLGVVVFNATAESLVRGCSVIVDNGNLIKKLSFPSEILPLNVVLVSMVTMLFAVGMFILAAWFTPAWIPPGPMLVWAPVLILLQGLFTFGVLLLLSTLQVFLRDTAQLISVLVTAWMFGTPIFWDPALLPDAEATIGPYMGLIEANPMFHLVYAWRVVLMSSEPQMVFTHEFLPSVGTFAVWAVAVFAVGYSFFVLSQRRFADEV